MNANRNNSNRSNGNNNNKIKNKKNQKQNKNVLKNNSNNTTTLTKYVKKPAINTANLVSKVCGITDPFCAHAKGAKYPDSSSIRTLTYTSESSGIYTTSASGSSFTLFNPQYAFSPITGVTTFSGSTATAWANYAAQTLISSVSQYRIVSCGLVLRRISAPLSTSGIVSIRIWGSEILTSFDSVDCSSYNATFAQDIPLQDCEEVTVILPRNAQRAESFYNVSGDTATVTGSYAKGFAPLTVYVSGAPASTAIIQAYYVINYELVFTDESGLGQVASTPPPANAIVTQASSYVTSTLSPIVKQGIREVGRRVVNAAGRAVATYMLGPAAATALAITVD